MPDESEAPAEAEAEAAPAAVAAPAKPAGKRATRVPGGAPPAEAAPAAVAAPEGLPNAIDIDAHAIAAPVLTRQGWVVPADKPNPAARR